MCQMACVFIEKHVFSGFAIKNQIKNMNTILQKIKDVIYQMLAI